MTPTFELSYEAIPAGNCLCLYFKGVLNQNITEMLRRKTYRSPILISAHFGSSTEFRFEKEYILLPTLKNIYGNQLTAEYRFFEFNEPADVMNYLYQLNALFDEMNYYIHTMSAEERDAPYGSKPVFFNQ